MDIAVTEAMMEIALNESITVTESIMDSALNASAAVTETAGEYLIKKGFMNFP